jgi:tetratricopeptide (TPR) repeat protein
MSSPTFDVFISYSHGDADWVRNWLLPRLESAGLSVCIDFRDFELGLPSIINMENAAQHSAKTLLVLTPNWVQSEWTSFESLLIQTKDPVGTRRRLLPLMRETCTLPDRLGIFTYADFTDLANWDAELARLITSIRGPIQQSTERTIQPNLVHPYPLQANFTGRQQERDELTAWLADEAHPICALVAIGGMGKSALAWYWVTRDVLSNSGARLNGVMWWSFYEGESSFVKFIDEALKYVSGQAIDAERLPTTYDRAQELRKQLQTKRVLFVLDGFERQLRAYARLDAAYQREDDIEHAREDRACVDPIAARLLRDIVAGTTLAKVLLTTRLMVHELEDRAGDVLAGVLNRELKELPRDDAVEFMQAQGVTKGTDAEIAAACAVYVNHPLSLRLLSGLIARDVRTPGDIAAAPHHDVHDDLIQQHHHILEQSYNALPKRESILLSRIAAFRNPMTYDALLVFNTLGSKAKFEAALEDLRVRGLLQRDTARNRYGLHPIVRHYAYDRLNDKISVHTRLRDYFAKIPVPPTNKIQSIEDYAPVIELYHHTVRARRYDEAFGLFAKRLHEPLYFRFGAYQAQIELLRALFPNGEECPPRLKEKSQGWVLSALANSYTLSGQPRRAVPLYKQQIAIREKQGDKHNFANGLGNIAEMAQIILGELAAADRNLRLSIELSREINDEFNEAASHQGLALLIVYCGAFDEAVRELDMAIESYENYGATQSICVVWSYQANRALLMGDACAALKAARQARALADVECYERDIIRAEWLLGAALVMDGKDLSTAAKHLTEALTRCRRINLVELESDILLTLARWHLARRNAQEAQTYAEEALAIADRCEYRLKQADIHNFLAHLVLDAGNREMARQHAETAHERAWCDGPPHCYKPALDEAEAILRELGAKE